MTKLEAVQNQYQKALKRLDEILQEEKTDIVRDSAIKRFEFTFDLSWKLIKAFLEEKKGIVCKSPKGCFREAYHQNLIDYDEFWIKMTDWRNEIVHNYGEQFADSLFENLPQALERFLLLAEKISSSPDS